MTSWTDMFTYGTEIAYDFTTILLKYYKNLDLDGSSSLNKEEFRISYSKMSLLAAHVEMDILDSNDDGILMDNELKTFKTLAVRGANVCLPSKFHTSGLLTIHFRSICNSLPVYLQFTSGSLTLNLETKDVYNMVMKMHAESGITNVADVYNLSKYNSRIMAAFLPEYEQFVDHDEL